MRMYEKSAQKIRFLWALFLFELVCQLTLTSPDRIFL